MKRFLSLLLVLCLALSVMSLAGAETYKTYDENPSTFETLEEALVNGPAFMEELFGGAYCNNPCLADYHEGTTYVYRSANRFSSASAGYRKNTTILVYVDQQFETKDDALAYIKDMGLVDIIEECRGSVVLVTPIAPYTQGSNGMTGGFGIADQYDYYLLQTAMCNLGGTAGGSPAATTAEGAYYGGTTFRYLIGIDGGATFISNYIASNFDYVTRLAGLLLVGGHMDRIRDVAGIVPTYLVNCSERVLEKYKAANDVDARGYIGDVDYYFNQAPYSLCRRNAIIGDELDRGGVRIIEVKDTETFKDIITPDGFYMDVWYELLPECVLDNTAPEHSVPLLLGIHGGSDHPLQFLDECGYLDLMGDELFAVVAPCHQNFYNDAEVLGNTLAASVEYMLDKYPALDPSRVYATGYSKGGGSTVNVGTRRADLFAAIMPMAAGGGFIGTDEQIALLNKIGMPIMMFTSRYDVGFNGTIVAGYQATINRFLGYNGLHTIDEFDFDTYPITGFAADIYKNFTVNGDKEVMQWQFCNEEGTPLVGYNFTEENIHALYPGYGYIAWDFARHFARNQETGAIEYHPEW